MTTKKSSSLQQTKKRSAATSTTKRSTKPRKQSVRQPAKQQADTVDFYPNRMTVAISVLAGSVLVLLSVIVVLNNR